MPFVNEYIPQEDWDRYCFEELNKRPKQGLDASKDWTIDRSADIWLRKFYTESDHTEPDGGYTGISVWDFWWKSIMMVVKVEDVEMIGGGIGQDCKIRKKLLSINIPSNYENMRKQIIEDLEAAFVGHKDAGVLSQSSSFSFILEL